MVSPLSDRTVLFQGRQSDRNIHLLLCFVCRHGRAASRLFYGVSILLAISSSDKGLSVISVEITYKPRFSRIIFPSRSSRPSFCPDFRIPGNSCAKVAAVTGRLPYFAKTDFMSYFRLLIAWIIVVPCLVYYPDYCFHCKISKKLGSKSYVIGISSQKFTVGLKFSVRTAIPGRSLIRSDIRGLPFFVTCV